MNSEQIRAERERLIAETIDNHHSIVTRFSCQCGWKITPIEILKTDSYFSETHRAHVASEIAALN